MSFKWMFLSHPRSGHHAIIDWYCSNCGHEVTHVNNPVLNDDGGISPTGAFLGHAYNGEMRTEIGEGVYSLKDSVINIERPDCHLLPPKPAIIVVREFNNFLSSVVRLAETLGDPSLPELSIPAWEWCAAQAVNGAPHILFDEWASNRSYMIAIGRQLGIITDGEPWERVSPFGGTREHPGSSFDGMTKDGMARLMDVCFRDKSDSPIFKTYATPERLALNERLTNV